MFRDVSKHYLIAWGCFILGTMFLMLNVLGDFFNILFSVFILAGLVTLLIKKIGDYIRFKDELSGQKESMVVDMALSSTGSFEVKKTEFTKKQLREMKSLKREKFMPILILLLMTGMMIFLTVRLIISIFNI